MSYYFSDIIVIPPEYSVKDQRRAEPPCGSQRAVRSFGEDGIGHKLLDDRAFERRDFGLTAKGIQVETRLQKFASNFLRLGGRNPFSNLQGFGKFVIPLPAASSLSAPHLGLRAAIIFTAAAGEIAGAVNRNIRNLGLHSQKAGNSPADYWRER